MSAHARKHSFLLACSVLAIFVVFAGDLMVANGSFKAKGRDLGVDIHNAGTRLVGYLLIIAGLVSSVAIVVKLAGVSLENSTSYLYSLANSAFLGLADGLLLNGIGLGVACSLTGAALFEACYRFQQKDDG